MSHFRHLGIYSFFLLFILNAWATPAPAAQGLSLGIENQFIPLGKRIERIPPQNTETAIPESCITRGERLSCFGRETTEWLGLTGFVDLNNDWRIRYGLHSTLIGSPLLKLSGGIGYMINSDLKFPVRPYLLAGLDPIFSFNRDFPPVALSAHLGLGLEFSWNNALFTQFEVISYLLAPYGNPTIEGQNNVPESSLQSQWLPGAFSLSGKVGFFF